VLDRVRDKLRQPTAEMRRVKDVFENAAKIAPRDLVCVNAHCAVSKIERSYIVKPKNVIDVTMRYQNRIKVANICPQRLLPKIG
jgi:hypothetical protein